MMDAAAQGFFMLRRPMFPLDTLYNFNELAGADPDLFERELISIFTQPLTEEALFTASPGLYRSFEALKEGRLNSGREKLLMTLYKYLVRMCSRATPYGLFAGIASGTISSHTSIEFVKDGTFKKHTRLDMALLAQISRDFQEREHIRERIRFFPNTSLTRLDDCYRYIERVPADDGYTYVLSAVEVNEFLESILAVCGEGSTIEQMAQSVSEVMPKEQAHELVEAMIGSQLLCSELDMNVTGPLYQDLLTNKLITLGANSEAALLENIRILTGMQTNIGHLLQMQGVTETHFPKLKKENLIQTDLRFETTSCQIGQECINMLAKEFEKVQYLLLGPVPEDIDSFKKDFFQKYENREVPLLTALDNESGIGFGSLIPGNCDPLPLLDDLNLRQQKDTFVNFDDLAQFKAGLFERAMAGKTMTVELTDPDFANFKKKSQSRTEGFYWLGSLIASSQEAVDKGNFKFVLKAAAGPSGLELMGRFSHTDQQLDGYLRASASQQCNPNYILAEIAHLPDPRTANILQRSHIREYEIVFLCGSCLPRENQIPPSDLMVSVPNGKEVILRSRRLNKRIIPRMSTAHNFSEGLPLYRFLCQLSSQHSGQLQGWDWGPYSNRVFLPRVQYKHWIISRANWVIGKSDYKAVFEKNRNFEAEWGIIQKNLQIPRYIQIAQGDNELLIDCDSTVSLALLKDIFSKQENVRLTEFPDIPGQGMLQDKGRYFTNEIVVPFRMNLFPTVPAKPFIPLPASVEIQRDFAVGSAWLYVKIYMGTKSADDLLSSLIKPFCEGLLRDKKIEKWFFIRYQDPLPHLRLRFYNEKEPGFWQAVLGSLSDILKIKMGNGTISGLQTDTYKREIERYQGIGFEQIESVFYADSQAVSDIIATIPMGDEQLRWHAGLAGTDQLLDDLGYAGNEKLKLIEDVYTELFKEYSEDDTLAVQLNDQYRRFKKDIDYCLDEGPAGFRQTEPTGKIFALRSEKVSLILKSQSDTVTLGNMTASGFIHMFLNRLFISRSREHELVIYHYLYKYHKSKAKFSRASQRLQSNSTVSN